MDMITPISFLTLCTLRTVQINIYSVSSLNSFQCVPICQHYPLDQPYHSVTLLLRGKICILFSITSHFGSIINIISFTFRNLCSWANVIITERLNCKDSLRSHFSCSFTIKLNQLNYVTPPYLQTRFKPKGTRVGSCYHLYSNIV